MRQTLKLVYKEMSTYQKYGLVVLGCFVCIVVFVDFFASWNFNIKQRSSFQSYLPYYYYNKDNQSNSNYYDGEESFDKSIIVSNLMSSSPYNLMKNNNTNISAKFKPKSFISTFQTFPWNEFEESIAINSTTERLSYCELFIDKLSYFLELEPLIPINQDCKPPPLQSQDEIDCSQYPTAFSGIKRTQPVKIGALIQFGFDVDVLEIHLNELFGIVDQIFIIESTHAHYGRVKKPLMWEQVHLQERFKKFPVIHLIIDDAEASKASEDMWAMESLQEKLRWSKFLEWNDATKYFNDDDIIGFGDADEIPSRAKLHLLKYCEVSGESVDFGIWFPFGHIKQAFQTDFPIRGHPLTLGDPTYYKLKAAKSFANKQEKFPSRRRGGSSNYLLGGMHMTHYGYLPFQLVKRTTATEGGLTSLQDVQNIAKYFKSGDIRKMEITFGATPQEHMRRIQQVNLEDPEMKEICVLPWFYDCNRNRYPVWEDGHDTRLD